jgi:hypothetical protein
VQLVADALGDRTKPVKGSQVLAWRGYKAGVGDSSSPASDHRGLAGPYVDYADRVWPDQVKSTAQAWRSGNSTPDWSCCDAPRFDRNLVAGVARGGYPQRRRGLEFRHMVRSDGRIGRGRRVVSLLAAAVVSLRPRQWVKNFFVFAGLIFSQSLFTPLVWPALGAFLIFCALSGAIYVFNDLADVDKDRLHPVKRNRPIARGALPAPVAMGLGVGLLVLSLGAAFSRCPSAS